MKQASLDICSFYEELVRKIADIRYNYYATNLIHRQYPNKSYKNVKLNVHLFSCTYQWKLVEQVFRANDLFNNDMSPIRKCIIHKPFYKLTITPIFRQTTHIFQCPK